eukprot:2260981-Prymnesium_polylepis.2
MEIGVGCWASVHTRSPRSRTSQSHGSLTGFGFVLNFAVYGFHHVTQGQAQVSSDDSVAPAVRASA